MSSFRLLNLPVIIIGEVFKSMLMPDLLELSFTSKKVAKILKLGGTKSLKFIINSDNNVILQNKTDTFIIYFDPPQIHQQPLDYHFRNYPSQVYAWSLKMDESLDMETKIRITASYLIEILGCRVERLVIWNQFKEFADWILEKQTEIECLEICQMEIEDEEHFKKFLDTMKVNHSLRILSKFSDNFQYSLKYAPKQVYIENSSWFTEENFLNLEWEKLFLNDSCLRNVHFDLLIKKWKAGNFPSLKIILIYSENIDKTEIAGMTPPILHAQQEKNSIPFWESDGDESNVNVSDCVEIETDDKSVKGSFSLDRSFIFYVPS